MQNIEANTAMLGTVMHVPADAGLSLDNEG
jgi:hypothetical protein